MLRAGTPFPTRASIPPMIVRLRRGRVAWRLAVVVSVVAAACLAMVNGATL